MKHTPSVIVIGGFAGAGKTTIAAKLASDFNYPIYSSDTINTALRDTFDKSFHEMSPHAYDILWSLVREQLKYGITIILDIHMARPEIWSNLDLLMQRIPEIQVHPIILEASLETHRKRSEERGRTNKEHLNLGGDRIEDVLHKYEFIKNLKRDDLIRIDANQDVNKVYSSVLSALRMPHGCLKGGGLLCYNESMKTQDIHKASGIIIVDRKVLVERSVGKEYFIHPGGKIEAGETPKQAVIRELKEEFQIDVLESDLRLFDTNSAPAANSPEVNVHMEVFIVEKWTGEIVPDNEVEEIRWITSQVPSDIKLGSIMEHETIPKLKAENLID